MKKRDFLELIADVPMDADMNFYLLPDDEGLRNESDEFDEPLYCVGAICTSGIDGDEPYIDLGFGKII